MVCLSIGKGPHAPRRRARPACLVTERSNRLLPGGLTTGSCEGMRPEGLRLVAASIDERLELRVRHFVAIDEVAWRSDRPESSGEHCEPQVERAAGDRN